MRIFAAAAAALVISFSSLVPARADSCRRDIYGTNATATSCGRLGWSYHPDTKTFGYGSQVTASDDPTGSKFVYQLVADCDQNVGGGATTGLCANFATCPPRVDPDGTPLRVARFQGMRAPKGPTGRRQGPLQPFGAAICVYQGRSVPMAAVVGAVRDQLAKQVGRPVATVQPASRGLIHWPMVFSAPAQRTTTLSITRPLRGAITATPDYTWDLGAGQTGHGSGHRYTEAREPRSADTDGYYVKATYPTPGTHQVTLTLTWTARIHLGAAAGGLDVDLDPIVFTARATATVVSATNRLYSAPGP